MNKINKLTIIDDVLAEVCEERLRQDKIWSQQNHNPFAWLTILGEEYGEACKAALNGMFGQAKLLRHYRKELIETAAVAVAAIESLDRNELRSVASLPEEELRWTKAEQEKLGGRSNPPLSINTTE